MRFSDTFLEKNSIRQLYPDPPQVVGELVIWEEAEELAQPWGLLGRVARFHGAKTPSFHADDRRGIYHSSSGCGVTGDHFRFLTERGGMSFPEAVEEACRGWQACPCQRVTHGKRGARGSPSYTRTASVMESATRFFEAGVLGPGCRVRGRVATSPGAGSAYPAQARFRLGFAPDNSSGLKEHCRQWVSAEEYGRSGSCGQSRRTVRCRTIGSGTGHVPISISWPCYRLRWTRNVP